MMMVRVDEVGRGSGGCGGDLGRWVLRLSLPGGWLNYFALQFQSLVPLTSGCLQTGLSVQGF